MKCIRGTKNWSLKNLCKCKDCIKNDEILYNVLKPKFLEKENYSKLYIIAKDGKILDEKR